MLEFEQFAVQPIPVLRPPTGWKSVAICECGEPLVALSVLHHARIMVEPEYFNKGLAHALEEVYVREGVAHRLAQVASQLPAGYFLLVWDAWRPLAVQQQLFDAEFQALQEQCPTLAEDEVRRRTEIYVSLPSCDRRRPSPHYTGGAVDLTLAGPDGRPVPMETGFDSFTRQSRTRALEERQEGGEHLSLEEEGWLHNRRLLYHTMVSCGFTNYCEEWWHFDYGDQFWGKVTATSARYGGIEPVRASASW
ncbi:MAG TPA: M15 family metallopeptidase [Ktedonobacteraceae bacterium]|jgi:D-alanyl-D-alanine dipeptidase